MAITNTSILIKRSSTTERPTALSAGELAYSYQSNVLFLGTASGGVMNIGGQFYTSTIDSSTAANVASQLVRRGGNGEFVGRLYGVANTAVTLDNSRNFSISGTDITATTQAFNGGADVVLNASLNAVPGLSAGSYGSTTAIPVVTVGANGRILAIGTNTISTSFDFSDGTTSNTINGSATFLHLATKGITTAVSANTVTFGTDNTVLRSNTTAVGSQVINTNLTVNSDLIVSGNLVITGNVSSQNVQQLAVNDPLIVLGIGNYVSDTKDIGFAAHYNDGSNAHTGLIRDSVTKEYHFFTGYTPDVDANNNVNINDATFSTANVNANFFKGNLIATSASVGSLTITGGTTLANTSIGSLTLGSPLAVTSGGTGQTSFTQSGIIYGSGTSGLGVTALAGASDQTWSNQILTVNNSGVPIWSSTMDGGTF